jgi:uncharacterized protein (DUF362 family)
MPKPSTTGATTSTEVVEAIIKLCKDGACKVVVGDGPTLGLDVEKVFNITGFSHLCKRYNIKLLNLNEEESVEVKVNNTVFESMKIVRPVTESDVLLNVPAIKTHIHTKISASVKNLKGALSPSEKKRLHKVNLIQGVAELPLFFRKVAPVQIVLVDGVVAHQGLGPMSGEPIELGILLCGREPVCVDEVIASIMGYELEEVPYLCKAKELLSSPSPLLLGDSLPRKEFKKPPDTLEEEFEGVKILDEGACSACIGTLTVALKRMKEEGELSLIKEKVGTLCIVMGAPKKEIDALAIGNCTKSVYKKYVAGCPPQGFLVRDVLRELLDLPPLHGKVNEYIDTL